MEYSLTVVTNNLLDVIPLIGLYAETHFRFWIPFSRYFKKEPELIFDTPWRLEPGQDLTFFLVVKDAHTYPTMLDSVEIEVYQNEKMITTQKWVLDKKVQEMQSDFEFTISKPQLPSGEITVFPRLNYSISGKQCQMLVDNYSQTQKDPLRITISDSCLPSLEGWLAGDTHLHTSLTNDQIEFGASLRQTRMAAKRLGLDFITATDHSYDLDDDPSDYLQNDPDLTKWHQSRKLINNMNLDSAPTIIPGEEISVFNRRGATVHFLHYNDPIYFPGSGDSGEDWPKLSSEISIDDVLSQRSPNTISVGAHTGYRFPFLQRLLLKRGHWEDADHNNPDLDGVQILSGSPSYIAFHTSRQLWIDALLRGKKLAVYGGSDGHGNFNRNWHIKLPVWSMGTSEDQIFGQCRTLVKSDSAMVDDLTRAMKQRRTALSTGPVGDLNIISGNAVSGVGDTVQANKGDQLEVRVIGHSSTEFGEEMDFTLYLGDLYNQEETILSHFSEKSDMFEMSIELSASSNAYVRLEISSEGSRWPGIYLSSPIWIDVD